MLFCFVFLIHDLDLVACLILSLGAQLVYMSGLPVPYFHPLSSVSTLLTFIDTSVTTPLMSFLTGNIKLYLS